MTQRGDDAWTQSALIEPVSDPLARVCGLDEVGRGALAGPLVAAAVILPPDIRERLGPLARYLRDSKKVPRPRRAEVAAAVREHAVTFALAVATVESINSRGIGWANRMVFARLIEQIVADEYIIDGKLRPPAAPDRAARVRCLVKADALAPAVSAASLLAKVYRDHLMTTLASERPGYGWERNAGYGSAEHLAALRTLGPTEHHRILFVTTALSGGQQSAHSHTERSSAAKALVTADILLTED